MRVAWLALLALLIPIGATAQTPAPVEGQHGAAYVSYGYTSGSSASLDNLQFDLDLVLPGNVVSFTGHFTDQTGVHVGPTGSYQVGPITVFGRHLFLLGGMSWRQRPSGTRRAAVSRYPYPRARCSGSACTTTRRAKGPAFTS